MPALYDAVCSWKLPPGILEGQANEYWGSYQGSDSLDRIDELREFRHDNFQAAAFRKADYRELKYTAWSNNMCYFNTWYGWEEDLPLWSYVGLFDWSESSTSSFRRAIHIMQERYLIQQSGAINDKETWLKAMPSIEKSWKRFLSTLSYLETDSTNYYFPTDDLWYLNQDLQRAVYFESDYYTTLDSIAQEYISLYESFASKKTSELDSWDLSFSFSRKSSFFYHPDNADLYWNFYYPNSYDTQQEQKEAYTKSILLEKELFEKAHSLERGISDDSLRFSSTIAPYNIEINHSVNFTLYLELSNWKRFLEQDLMPDTMRHELIQRYNSLERSRRTSMFLRDVIIPWYSRFNNDPNEAPEEFASRHAIAVHWDLLENVFQSGTDDPYFVELYAQILMTIQEKIQLCIDPEYFGQILNWYVENSSDLNSEERLRAFAVILQMKVSLQPSMLDEFDNKTPELMERFAEHLEAIEQIELLFDSDFGK